MWRVLERWRSALNYINIMDSALATSITLAKSGFIQTHLDTTSAATEPVNKIDSS